MEEAFLQALRDRPDDPGLRLIFADWLDERGDLRCELLRVLHELTQSTDSLEQRPTAEHRLRTLLASGVQPVGPFWTNSLGMTFAWVPAGVFRMGSAPGEPHRQDNETPHRVTLTSGCYLGIHPVTQGQWQEVLRCNPSRFKGDNRPVEGISWEDCQEFCRKLAKLDGLCPGLPTPYRLPTEAEWEYACRAGTTSAYFWGESLSAQQANFHMNLACGKGLLGKCQQETSCVDAFPANAWGLHDMHGNVFEWCADEYLPYAQGDVFDPSVQGEGELRVLRGGSWHSLASRCRSACRAWAPRNYRGSDVGCRICFRVDYDYAI